MGRLNLSRHPGESIRIGEHGEIEITVVRVRGQSVDLAIAADATIPIHREEIFRALEAGVPPKQGKPPATRHPTTIRRHRERKER